MSSGRTFDMSIKLTRKQRVMFNMLNEEKYKEVLFYGSSRSGKTFLIIYWMMVQCVVYGSNCLVLRNLFTSLQLGMLKQTLPAVLKVLAEHNGYKSIEKVLMNDGQRFCKFNGKDNYLKFFNGAYIQFASMRGSSDNDSTFDKILSSEWGHIFIDEVSEVEERAVDILRTRLAQKLSVRNKLLFALNPTRKSGWTYVRFFKHETREGLAIPEDTVAGFLVVKFSLSDNMENVAEDYKQTLESMSSLQRKRFLDGDYFDESEGEIFKKINWSDTTPENKLPTIDEWQSIGIYTDPSAKDSKTSDFKASVMLGRARNKIWLIDVRAVQGTSLQMLENIRDLYLESPNPHITKIWMERKQVPLDFKITYEKFQEQTGWVCPLEWDTRNMGDKFTAIESILEPLFHFDKFFFNAALKNTSRGGEAVDQFLYFSRKPDPNRKDDIPDACMRGVSLLNRPGSVGSGYTDTAVIIKKPKRTFF
jgi:PBSX family phage terminase large subunit